MPLASVFVVVPSLASVVGPNSTSVGFGGSGCPNLTMGKVSKMALPKPLALLCLGRPSTSLGP